MRNCEKNNQNLYATDKSSWTHWSKKKKKKKTCQTRRNADDRRDVCALRTTSIFAANHVPDCVRLGHGHTPLENEKIQNRKADHVWPESVLWLYTKMHSWASLQDKSLLYKWPQRGHCRCFKHCGVQFRFADLNCNALRLILFLWSSEEESTVDFNSMETLQQQEGFHFFLSSKLIIHMRC